MVCVDRGRKVSRAFLRSTVCVDVHHHVTNVQSALPSSARHVRCGDPHVLSPVSAFCLSWIGWKWVVGKDSRDNEGHPSHLDVAHHLDYRATVPTESKIESVLPLAAKSLGKRFSSVLQFIVEHSRCLDRVLERNSWKHRRVFFFYLWKINSLHQWFINTVRLFLFWHSNRSVNYKHDRRRSLCSFDDDSTAMVFATRRSSIDWSSSENSMYERWNASNFFLSADNRWNIDESNCVRASAWPWWRK